MVAADLNNLGTLESARDHYAAAEQYLRDSLAIQQRLGRTSQVETLMTLANLAAVYSHQKRLDEADRTYIRLVSFLDEDKTINEPVLAASLLHYADRLHDRQDSAEAERLRARAMQMQVRSAVRRGA